MASSSALSTLVSWFVVALFAIAVVGGGLLWSDDSEIWGDAGPSFASGPVHVPARTPEPAEAPGGNVPGKGAATDADSEDSNAGSADTSEVVDPEDLVDETPAEPGQAPAHTSEQPKVTATDLKNQSVHGDWYIHRVVPAETIDQIAYRYGVREEEIRMWNGVKTGVTEVRPGTRLRLHPNKNPPPRQVYDYYVQPEDTWARIGASLGVDSRDLRRSNPSVGRRLMVGDRLDVWIDPVVYLWVTGGPDPHVPPSVRLGAVSIGPPQAGRLVNGVQLPPHPAYVLRFPAWAHGTTYAVAHVVEAMELYREQVGDRPPLQIGSMSLRHGGPLSGHRSHQTGRDLDIRLPLRADLNSELPVLPDYVDWIALWYLLDAFDRAGHVRVIFLDYELQERVYKAAATLGVDEDRRKEILQWPRGNQVHVGVVRHSSGHADHIHVRLPCGPNEPECVADADYVGEAD